MLYTEFIYKAFDATVIQADNGLFYLEPLWRNILFDNQLDIKDISDAKTDWDSVLDVLRLEVEKRNTINSVKPYILNWVNDTISTTVEPAILAEETDYIKNLTEYLKANKDAQALKDKEDWDNFKKID